MNFRQRKKNEFIAVAHVVATGSAENALQKPVMHGCSIRMIMKLTEEQANWLQGVFDRETRGIRELAPYDIRVILHDCTEKEFPRFEVEDVFVDIDERDENMISISFTDTPSSDAYWGLTRTGFKLFTEKCLVICEWLKEND